MRTPMHATSTKPSCAAKPSSGTTTNRKRGDDEEMATKQPKPATPAAPVTWRTTLRRARVVATPLVGVVTPDVDACLVQIAETLAEYDTALGNGTTPKL